MAEAELSRFQRIRTQMTRRKILVGVLVALGGLLAFRLYGALWGSGGGPARGGPGGGGRAQPVEVAQAERTELSENVSLVGSLRAKEQVDVAPKVGGRLVELRVDLGDSVRAGQLIGRLEDGELSQQVRRAEAALQVSRASPPPDRFTGISKPPPSTRRPFGERRARSPPAGP